MNKINPKLFDHLKEKYYRNLSSPNDEKSYFIAEKGDRAEIELFKIIKNKIPKSWILKPNYWIQYSRTNEIDIIIFTGKFVWLVECKNYSGVFEYMDGNCYRNKKPINNEISFAQNRKNAIENILSDNKLNSVPVYSSMIFMDNECDVKNDRDSGIELVMRYRLSRHINEMVQRYQTLPDYFDNLHLEQTIDRYRINHPFPPKIIPVTLFKEAKTGIHCAICYSYLLKNHYKTIECQDCGYIEYKTEARLRTTAELGMLFYHDDKILTPKNIVAFSGQVKEKDAFLKSLYRKWPTHSSHRGVYYHNFGLPYEAIRHKLKKSK